MESAIPLALLVFAIRTLDVSLSTVRMLAILRGLRLVTWVLGFISALLFVVAIQAVLGDLTSWPVLIGYCGGYATGNVVGMWAEEKLAMGFTHLRIVSSAQGPAVIEKLRRAGFAATEIPGFGRDGAVTTINCSIHRKDADRVKKLVASVDPHAFINAEEFRTIQRGFWKS